MREEKVAADIGAHHVRLENLDRGLGPLVEVDQNIFRGQVCALVPKRRLSILALDLREDR